MPELNSSILEIYQTVSLSVCLSGYPQVCVCLFVCLSAPGFTLGSASGQTVSPLPGALHQGEGLTTTLLHRCIGHLFVGKVNLWTVKTRVRVQPDGQPMAAVVGFKLLYADILGNQMFVWITWKMSFHVLSNTSSSRSLSSHPLKYKTHGGRNWVRSAANSYPQSSERENGKRLSVKV